jgi:hypothetical protein
LFKVERDRRAFDERREKGPHLPLQTVHPTVVTFSANNSELDRFNSARATVSQGFSSFVAVVRDIQAAM